MSTLADFSIVPMGKGEGISTYVARAVSIIRDSGLPYSLNPMGTSIEGEYDEVMDVVRKCFDAMQKDCDRVYMTIKLDYRRGIADRMQRKIRSVEAKL